MAPWSYAYPLHSVPWIQPEQPITNCFDAWAVVSNFTFEKVRDESHAKLRVTFTQRDGPRGTVASAKISLTDPTIHFDEEESWLIGAVGGSVNLKNVVTQEIGHILGLAHSQVEKVVMYATFSYGVTKKLAQDDIDGIRAKYSTWCIDPHFGSHSCSWCLTSVTILHGHVSLPD